MVRNIRSTFEMCRYKYQSGLIESQVTKCLFNRNSSKFIEIYRKTLSKLKEGGGGVGDRSISIDINRNLSKYIEIYLKLSKYIEIYRKTLSKLKEGGGVGDRSISIDINRNRSKYIEIYRNVSKNVIKTQRGRWGRRSIDINRYQSISIEIDRYISKSIDIDIQRSCIAIALHQSVYDW